MNNSAALRNPSDLENRRLTAVEFQGLAVMPAEAEWFANLDNPQTRRAYQSDLRHFMAFIGINEAEEFRQVQRSHVIKWRDQLCDEGLAPSSVRRKLAAVSSLYSYLCNENAVEQNPAAGVRRPKLETYEGQTPILDDADAAALLEAPDSASLRGLRDRAILSTLLYQALRREELTRLRVKDRRANRGGIELVVRGKGGKTRFVPLHPHTARAMHDYLTAAGHINSEEGALFRAVRGENDSALSTDAIYKIVCRYLGNPAKLGFNRYGPHSLRATAATNALENNADIAKVQEWLGHASVATTRVYDRRRTRPEDSPTFKVSY